MRTDSDRGTGRPAAASSRVVSSLSPAMSTASAEVFDVIVARIRCWWTPCPSCTSECSLSRSHGMSRDTASSRIAWVDGPNAVRSACSRNRSSSASKSNSGLGPHQVVDQPDREACRPRRPTLLVDVPVDDVVLTGDAGAAGLAAADVVAGLLLQLQGHVLGDVPEPGALLQPLEEAAAVAARAGVPGQPGQRLEQPVDEAGDGVGGVVLEGAQVDDAGGSPARRTTCSGRGRRASAGS